MNSRLYCYRFYGINLQINRKLTQFTALPSHDSCDLKVNLARLNSQQKSKFLEWNGLAWEVIPQSDAVSQCYLAKTVQHTQTYYRFRRQFGREFVEYIFNSQGDRVWGYYSAEILLQDAISMLLGFVLGNVIRLRGYLTFHASAIGVGDRAILLTGDSGAGKSTTAAALSERGCTILADDIAVLDQREGRYWVQPGYPCLRLFPESVAAFGTSCDRLTKVSPFGSKRYLDLAPDNAGKRQFQTRPLSLAAVYIMGQRDDRRDRSTVESLTSASAMTQLVKSVYGSCFLDKQQRLEEFKQLATLTRKIPVRQLSRADSLQNIAQLCELIINDAESLCIHTF